MKTLKVFFVLLFLYFSTIWAQAQVQSVNGWVFGVDAFNIVYPDATKSYFSGNSNSQIFTFKGPANMIDPNFPHLQATWFKNFPLSPSVLDTIYLDARFVSGENLKLVEICIALQNSNGYILIGSQKQYISSDGGWKTVKFNMKYTKDIGILSFIRFYLVFVGVAVDGSDVALTVEVKNLRSMDTNGYSIVYDKFWDITDVPRKNSLPTEFKLEQNYPNPFNPATTIKFSIPNSQFVNLKVYDVLGKEIATLVNEEKPAGNYEIKFNASNLPSGLYIYRLQGQNVNLVKKMMLMK